MSDRHYARDAIHNPLDIFHQKGTWPLQCVICANKSGKRRTSVFFFAPTTDSDNHFVCSIPLLPPHLIPKDDSPIDALPVIFTIIGQIAPEDCFLTSTGDQRDEDRPDHIRNRPIASCWMESRPDRDSCLEWRQFPSAIERVASTSITGKLDTSRLLRFAPNEGAVQLRMRFVPHGRRQLRHTIPFFDTKANTRIVPKTLEEVPFNTPLRASFMLEYYRVGGDQFLYAELVTLETL